jgi:uncharacterized membrane protein YkvA (DUF1232 family)
MLVGAVPVSNSRIVLMLGALGRSVFKIRMFGVEFYTLLLALRDSRTPWYARILGLVVAAYVVSPIDIVPDIVPLIGLIDELIIVPLGLKAISTLVPGDVQTDARGKAITSVVTRPRFWRWVAIVSVIVILAWLVLLGLIFYLVILWLL